MLFQKMSKLDKENDAYELFNCIWLVDAIKDERVLHSKGK